MKIEQHNDIYTIKKSSREVLFNILIFFFLPLILFIITEIIDSIFVIELILLKLIIQIGLYLLILFSLSTGLSLILTDIYVIDFKKNNVKQLRLFLSFWVFKENTHILSELDRIILKNDRGGLYLYLGRANTKILIGKFFPNIKKKPIWINMITKLENYLSESNNYKITLNIDKLNDEKRARI